MKQVSLFVTCVVDQIFPRTGLAMAEVLERLGYRIDFREAQTCCGQPAFNSGYRDEACKAALHFLSVFESAAWIVTPSGSCTAMITHHYEQIFAEDAAIRQRFAQLAERTWEFSRFLTEVVQVEDVGARLSGIATYHDSCHALRELHIKDQPRQLLRRVNGLSLREMDIAEECCGFGGTFSVKFPAISGSMVRTKVDAIVKTGANYVVSIDSSCLMQIQGALSRANLPVRAIHLAEVLAAR